MDLVSTVRKSGSRGGVNFSWDEVANSAHRENYLGHSLKAPVGRWQQGRDLEWYAKADADNLDPNETDEQRKARLRREEIQKIKEAEEDAMAKALGLPPPVRNQSGANAIEVSGSRAVAETDAETDAPANDDLKAGKRGGTGAIGSIATDTGIAAEVAPETAAGGEISTMKVPRHRVTMAEGRRTERTGAGAVSRSVTGDTDIAMSLAVQVVAATTDGEAGPETGTGTAADPRMAAGA